MKFATLEEVLPQIKNKHAIGHFNINGQMWIETILLAAENENKPIILATSERVVEYLGGCHLVKNLVENYVEYLHISVPVVLHLDHGNSIEMCYEAIDAGYSSVMYDGSKLPLSENIRNTKKVVDYAKKFNVSVEGEIGTVGGIEDGIQGGVQYADLDECIEFVDQTKVNALAAALGSVHGRYILEPNLGFDHMKLISEAVGIPLVLHGASGIPLDQVQKAIRLGHAKINVNTEINLAWKAGIEKSLSENKDAYEPRFLLEESKKNMINVIKTKINEFWNI